MSGGGDLSQSADLEDPGRDGGALPLQLELDPSGLRKPLPSRFVDPF
jgi:hypothetical protein